MAINIEYKQVRPIFRGGEFSDSAKVAQAVDPGVCLAPAADGRYSPGNAGGFGVAYTRALNANRTVALMRQGELDLGDSIQALAPGAEIFAAADGTLTDEALAADGTTENVRVGTIIPVRGGAAAAMNASGSRNLLRVEL